MTAAASPAPGPDPRTAPDPLPGVPGAAPERTGLAERRTALALVTFALGEIALATHTGRPLPALLAVITAMTGGAGLMTRQRGSLFGRIARLAAGLVVLATVGVVQALHLGPG